MEDEPAKQANLNHKQYIATKSTKQERGTNTYLQQPPAGACQDGYFGDDQREKHRDVEISSAIRIWMRADRESEREEEKDGGCRNKDLLCPKKKKKKKKKKTPA